MKGLMAVLALLALCACERERHDQPVPDASQPGVAPPGVGPSPTPSVGDRKPRVDVGSR